MARGFISKKGKIWYSVFPWQGKKKWVKLSHNKKDSERMHAEIMRDVHAGSWQELKTTTFKQLLDDWIKSKELRLKSSTMHGYKAIAKHLEAHFGESPVADIRPKDIEKYIQKKSEELDAKGDRALSNKTIGYHLGTLKAIFKQGMIWGHLTSNPADNITRPRAANIEIEFLDSPALNKLLAYCPDYYYPFIYTAAMTGMRWGEISELRWKDFDPLESILNVRRGTYKGEQDTPKSQSSKRRVMIPDDVVLMLLDHREKADNEDEDLMFPNTAGNHMNPSNFYRDIWDPMIEAAKVKPITFHGLRHTYAYIMLSNGAPIVFISKQLGHSDIQITLKHYGHFMPQDGRDHITKLQGLVSRNIVESIKKELPTKK